MPIYAYQCDDCKEPFEVFVRSSNATVKAVCPQCGSEHTEKQVTAFATIGATTGGSMSSSASACAPSG